MFKMLIIATVYLKQVGQLTASPVQQGPGEPGRRIRPAGTALVPDRLVARGGLEHPWASQLQVTRLN
jgi:hypothetical protein